MDCNCDYKPYEAILYGFRKSSFLKKRMRKYTVLFCDGQQVGLSHEVNGKECRDYLLDGKIMNAFNRDTILNIDNTFLKCKKKYVFGLGLYAMQMKEYLDDKFIRIDGFLVSDKSDINDSSLFGIPIMEMEEITFSPEQCGILLALREKYHKEVINKLHKLGFFQLYIFRDDDFRRLWKCLNHSSLNKIFHYLPPREIVRGKKSKKGKENILIVRTDGIGDMVMTTPLIRELRRNHPYSHITFLTTDVSFDLFEKCPYLDQVLACDVRMRNFTLRQKLDYALHFYNENLIQQDFDLAILPRWSTDYYGASFFAYLSGAVKRVAYSEKVEPDKSINNLNFDTMFTDILNERILKHEVERNLDILRYMGDIVCDTSLELWDAEQDRIYIRELLDNVVGESRLITIGVSASTNVKKWDIKNYISVINHLRQRGFQTVIVGGKEDAVEAKFLCEICGSINLVGKLSLREVVALMHHVVLYIGNDTGVMHVAAACGAKIVEISCHPLDGDGNGLYSIERFHPWQAKYEVLQPNKNALNGINDINPNEVIEKVEMLMK